jgi:hypothetical protein
MKRTINVFTGLFVLLWLCSFWAQAQKSTLLPTESVAIKIGKIQSELAAATNAETFQADTARHKQQFEQLKNTVTSFVIAQLEAAPEIEW